MYGILHLILAHVIVSGWTADISIAVNVPVCVWAYNEICFAEQQANDLNGVFMQ